NFLSDARRQFLRRATFGRNRVSKNHFNRPASDMLRLRQQYSSRSPNGHRHNGGLRLLGQQKDTALEGFYRAVKTRSAFREENQRHSPTKPFTGSSEGFDGR